MTSSRPLLVVSADGISTSQITRATMPTLTTLALQGSSSFTAQRAGDIFGAPSFLHSARTAGLRTAAFITCESVDAAIERDAVDERHVLSGGDRARERRRLDHASGLLSDRSADVVFVQLPRLEDDLDEPCRSADDRLATLVNAAGDETGVLVVVHPPGRPQRALERHAIVVRAADRIEPGTGWAESSTGDIAPTITDLCGLPAELDLSAMSLLGREEPLVDVLLDMLADTEHETYGERVTMLDHALQSAALAASDGASDEMVLACLLHDLGHVLGPAGDWGLADHASVGATMLQPLLAPAIVEPIRHHVTAKRYQVAVDPGYHDRLSTASQMSLIEQGGPLDRVEEAEFLALPFAEEALRLRSYDDDGKVEGLTIAPLGHYEKMLAEALEPRQPVDPAWARDACRCAECRDPGNDQHLLDADALADWTVVGTQHDPSALIVTLHHESGSRHRCQIPRASQADIEPQLWTAALGDVLRQESTSWVGGHSTFVDQLATRGIALAHDCGVEPGTVVTIGNEIGHVRSTNYGQLFDVVTEPDPVNLAYTPLGLPGHTDNPYREPCPTVQLLHCIAAADGGGASRFVDGLAVAEHLRAHDPESFRILATTDVNFRFHDDQTDLRARRPLIELHNDGAVRAISVNNRSMEPLAPTEPGLRAFYFAYTRFAELVASDRFAMEITLRPGEVVAFDNRRVLHGRRAFRATEPRHLQGCYIDIDAIFSAARTNELLDRPQG